MQKNLSLLAPIIEPPPSANSITMQKRKFVKTEIYIMENDPISPFWQSRCNF